ncbi:RraA family protein [Enterobacter cloacae]|uniref:Putative 4-hydroxy-4-methyl-2-oxoglutarate aldolase n=1 Tax=Atlantibacter subterraneus TaxID=255519 RepID=A0ABU4E8Z7_9ENTR|nr:MULTISPECIES: RraA family protein [Enterobacteriaceae]MDZ5668773.1 RraA family protein [Atlantibacter hermannii]MCD1394853.1 RraA family protein [Enterobacter cloacae]MCO4152204.1 RraA family protein [Citrobacter freundii]MCO4179032.1 RraA family protein [Citrobacter freundii]MDK7604146.1 RraA family protein [Citrobacter freundii]
MTFSALDSQVVDALLKLGTATIYEAQGAYGAIDCKIKPLDRHMKVAGRVFTLHMRPGDNLMIHYALLHIKRGDVLVINCDGFEEAGIWGDVLTTQAQYAGIAGLVVNGSVRDSEAIINSGFPVFSRSVSIRGTEKKQPGIMNSIINIGDCLLRPGDIIVGDSDGLVVIENEKLDKVIKLATIREEKETEYKNKILNGATTAELMNLSSTFESLNIKKV